MEIGYLITGLLGGIVLGFLVQKMLLKGKADKIISDAEFKAESIKKDKMFQAKERFLKLKQEHEMKIKER
jgi:ribonuclease Y